MDGASCNKVWTALVECGIVVVEVAGIGNGSHLDHTHSLSESVTNLAALIKSYPSTKGVAVANV